MFHQFSLQYLLTFSITPIWIKEKVQALSEFFRLPSIIIPTQGKECLISFIAKSNSPKPKAKQRNSKYFSCCDYNKGDYTQSWRRSWLSQDAN